MSLSLATGEKEPLRWEQGTDNALDYKDILENDYSDRLYLGSLFIPKDRAYERLILRRGKKAVGFLICSVSESFKEIKPWLRVDLVYIKPGNRSSAIFKNIVKTIHDIAKRRTLKRIEWRSTTTNSIKMTDKMSERYIVAGDPDISHIIPTEQFSIETFLNTQKEWKEEKRKKESDVTLPQHD